jgi:hypothetical protein
MKAKPYTVVTTRMPNELYEILETVAIEKGETVSTIVRDFVRRAALARGHQIAAPLDSLGVGSPPTARDFT